MSCRGFTLIELLVVIAIIAVLAAIAVPAASSAISRGQRGASLSNLRGIAAAFHQFAADQGGFLPAQVDGAAGLDWSGQLVVGGYASGTSFRAPADRNPRRDLNPPAAVGGLYIRSYGNNSSKYTYLQNGYLAPWPKEVGQRGARLATVPGRIILAGENYGGDAGAESGAYVGVAEWEGLDGLPRDLYPSGGACFVRADGSGFSARPEEMNEFRADTDYGGDARDPWKWKP